MSLHQRWSERGPNWRFPTRADARANLAYGFGALRRPWVVPIIIVMLVAFAKYGSTSSGPLLGMGIGSFLLGLGPPKKRPVGSDNE